MKVDFGGGLGLGYEIRGTRREEKERLTECVTDRSGGELGRCGVDDEGGLDARWTAMEWTFQPHRKHAARSRG